MLYKIIGERIRDIRKQRGMYHEEVADALGMTRTSIVNFEHGRQHPTIEKLLKIAKLFKCDVTDLMPSKGEYTPELKPFRNHIDIIRNEKVEKIKRKLDALKIELEELK